MSGSISRCVFWSDFLSCWCGPLIAPIKTKGKGLLVPFSFSRFYFIFLLSLFIPVWFFFSFVSLLLVYYDLLMSTLLSS